MQFIRSILLILLIVFFASHLALADSTSKPTESLPRGCEPVNYQFQGKQLVLGKAGETKQRLYLIENDLPNVVWVNHNSEQLASETGWSSQVCTSRWTAIAIKHGEYRLSCVEAQPGAEQYISCAKALRVCEMKHAKFKSDAEGSYLVAADKILADILYVIKQRGIDVASS